MQRGISLIVVLTFGAGAATAQTPLTVTTTSLANGTVGTAYSQTLLANGGTGGYSWSVTSGSLPPGLSIAAGGLISGTPTAVGGANFTVQVTDSSNATAIKSLTIAVLPVQLAVTTSSLASGTVGTAYSQTLAASGGTGGYGWSVAAGLLPAGLSLSAAGVISGMPAAAGTTTFTVQVMDSSNSTAIRTLSIAIAPAQLTVTTSSLASGTVGVIYAQTLAASGGTGGYGWSVVGGSLPAGLSLSPGGLITGTPTAAVVANFTVQVTDSSNATAPKPLSITIVPAQLTVTTTSLPNGTLGATYSQTLAATGGTGGYSWSVVGGSLPGGLSLSSAGAIGGMPMGLGSASFTVQVTDSSFATATMPLSIVIVPPQLTVVTALLPNGTAGATYSQTLTATGGTGGYGWSVVGGSLPAGLSLNAGLISGTPTAAIIANFTVQVTDSSNTTATKALSITIVPAQLTVTTTSLPNGTVGATYSQTLTATGGTGGNVWSVTGGNLPPGLSLSPAALISGTPTTATTANFTVQVTDSSNATTTQALSITIVPPPLTVTTTTLPNGTVGTTYSQALAAIGGTGGYAWSVVGGALPAGLSLNAAGLISGTPAAATIANFTVQVTDSSNATATKALSITIVPPPLTITTTALPSGTVGATYSQALTATGGTGGNAWSVTGGALPAGLSLSPAGLISGTPTAATTANFTVQVTDSSSATTTQALSITIAPPQLTVTTTTLPNGTVGATYSQTLAATGGTGGNAWSVTGGALPAGLSLSAAGLISGTPTAATTANFTVQVTDSSSATATKPLSITIAPPQLTITTTALPSGTVGATYSQALTATGGTGGNAWSVTGGALPAGLSLSPAGLISGTPTAATTANFTVQVTDSSSATTTQALSITIAPPQLTVTTTALPSGTVGATYSQTLAATGGTGGNAWSVTGGALPAGLSISAAGLISGTPTAATTANFTVQVADSSSATATKPLSITIAPPQLTVTTTSLPNGTVGATYSQTLAASGGTGGNVWSMTSGNLPTGLSLSSAGLLSGTPTAATTANFTVQVTDSSSATANKPLSITIAPPQLTVTTTSLPNGTVGTTYSQTLAASGGTGGNSWSVTGGNLPAGLSLNGAGLISGTPTAAGTINFTVQVTDNADATANKPLSITIAPPQLTVTTTSLPNGTVGATYSQTLAASGGAGGNAWTRLSGSLPTGLSLTAAGLISGTPTAAGTSNFTVQVTDSSETPATKSLSITIAPVQLTITTTSLPNGPVGAAYSQTLAASGGAGGNTWTRLSGSLPTGLSLTPAGLISGTPTAAGTSSFTVQVTDSSETIATKPLSITIAAPQLTVTTALLPNGTVGTAYSQTLAASGGTGGNAWTLTSGALPPGLSLSSAGLISGTPSAAGTTNFTVQVTDNSNATATKPLSITTAPVQLTITTTALANGVIGATYSQTLAASGGAGGNTWTRLSGSLPAGLLLTPAGLISGAPTAAGTSNFTVQVTDSSNTTATRSLSITIAPQQLTITTTSLPGGTVGTPYSQTLAATGGTAGNVWSIMSGSLPAGISLSPAGLLSGTPSSPGTATFELRVTDSSSATVSRVFSISILSQIVITTRTLRNGTLGSSYTESLAATGGVSPYIWSIISGQLPTGLTLDRGTGAISGTPSVAGTFSLVLEISDATQAKAVASLSITINRPLTLTTPAALTTASAGARYSQPFTATGGTVPYVWSVSGSLPAGLTFSAASGLLSGTPTQVGTFPISIRVMDATQGTATGNYSVQVVSGLAIATPPILPAATSGTPYTTTLQPAGGTAPYQWIVTAGSLPNGLTFSPAGQISGTPNAAGTFLFTAQVTDANLNTAQKGFTLTVAGPLIITTAQTLPAGVTQTAYAHTLAASGGTPPYQWTVTAGDAPPGLTLSAPTGTLAGRPNSTGIYNFTATVTDSISLAAQKQFTLAISQGITLLSPASLPGAVLGLPYTFSLEASGGVPPYSWSVVDGGLGSGLALNAATGAISGTPSASGTFNFTVQVVDSVQASFTRVHSIVVGAPTLPEVGFAGLPSNVQPLQQPLIDVALSSPYPLAITGTLRLSFTPLADNPDDPAVQFSTGGRSAVFTIPANATRATFGVPQFAVQTGSVAGTIAISVAGLQGGGISLPVPVNLTQTIEVSRTVPVIRGVSVARTSDGMQVQITAVSATRELSEASILFQPAPGSNLQTSQLTVPLAEVAKAWFVSGDSTPFGGQFHLILPFVFSGNVALSSVSVTLSNGVGTSSATSAAY